jgi:hypothetical protein
MPVTDLVVPKNLRELNKKVRDNIPGQEHLIVEDVKAHVSGGSSYDGIPTD